MDISKRIFCICELIEYDTLADIGCDHCYLPITAIQKGKIKSAIGIDVNQGPLKTAEENIKRASIEGKIELRLGYGLSPLKAGECESVVISGMGGMLIGDILLNDMDIAKSFKQIILSPQSDVAHVRRILHKHGFCIYAESVIFDKGKFYPIIMAKQGKDEEYSDFEYEYGKKTLDNPSGEFIQFIVYSLKKNENIIKNIGNADSLIKETIENENIILRRLLKID